MKTQATLQRTNMRGLCLLLLVVAGASARGAEVKFAAEPRAEAHGKKVKISFELATPADVAVDIVNAKGIVVRHLGGGLLGLKAPSRFKTGQLAQTLLWDRTDDRGKPLPAGKYQVRVRAGIIPKFERRIGYGPLALSSVLGLAVGPEGELFVLNSGGLWVEGWKPSLDIPVFSRDLKYLRTIMPWPGDLPPEKVKGFDPVKLPGEGYVPRIYHGPGRMGYPVIHGRPNRQTMLVTPAGDLLLTSQGRKAWALHRLGAADGAMSRPFVVNTILKKTEKVSGAIQMALSPDGKWAYLAGLTRDCRKEEQRLHAVYRYKVGADAPAELFVGKPKKSGSDEQHFNRPQGVAVDGKGNVLVSDWKNNRIVVFSATGKYLAAIKVDGPDFLAVDRKRNTVYVLSVPHDNPTKKDGRVLWDKKFIVKIKSWKEPEVLGRVSLPRSYSKPVLALDDGAEKPILWIGNLKGWFRVGGGLWRILDKNPAGALPEPELVGGRTRFPQQMAGVEHLAVDPATERLYVAEFISGWTKKPKWKAFDGKTGKQLSFAKVDAADLVVGYDGNLYGYHTGKMKAGHLCRWDPSGKPLPFASSGERSESLPLDPKDDTKQDKDREGVRGLGVAPNGDVYVLFFPWATRPKIAYSRLCVVGPDGKVKNKALVRSLSRRASSPRVDRYGNVYMMEDVLPKGAPSGPPGFAGLIKERAGFHTYQGIFGSIVKFPPTGGAVYVSRDKEKPGPPAGAKRLETANCNGVGYVVDGADWIRPYAAPVYGEGGHWCFCMTGRFGLDRYGRLFVPNAPARQVEIVDDAGNRIAAFGRYGNVDNGGRNSLRPVEGIPLNWGANVTVSDNAVYIGDTNNRCVVKVRLDYRATATCPVP